MAYQKTPPYELRNRFDDLDSFLNIDSPELIANSAVRFNRIAAIYQSLKRCEGKRILEFFAPASRTYCFES
jgi:hypothetical protein